jgi:hypothetical protein
MIYSRTLVLLFFTMLPVIITYKIYEFILNYKEMVAPFVWLISALIIFFITINRILHKDYGLGILLLALSSLMLYLFIYKFIYFY